MRTSAKMNLIPRTTATNAYDLLDEVIVAMEAEPRRVDMQTWIRAKERYTKDLYHSWPACGTVACVAGWITLLSRTSRDTMESLRSRPSQRATHILGAFQYHEILDTDLSEEDECFNDAVDNLFSSDLENEADALKLPSKSGDEDDPWGRVPDIGTPEYVQCVVHRIRTFQKRWETRLRATPIRRRANRAKSV